MKSAREATLKGQYEFKSGIYFGGGNFEPHVDKLETLIVELGQLYKDVLLIDLHTGFGKRGVLHLFGPQLNDSLLIKKVEKTFPDHKIDWPDQKDFYGNFGDFGIFVRNILNGKTVIPMTFECGTQNSQSITGSIKSLKAVILENQGTHFGYSNYKTHNHVKEEFQELFNPESPSWRSEIMRQNRLILNTIVQKMNTDATN